MAALSAFSENMTTSENSRSAWAMNEFSTLAARRMRYAVNWAMYENTAYRRVHAWSKSYKTTFGLYRYIRNIYNPAYRLGEFWQSHIWGGLLDPNAGDGSSLETAIPIATENEALRPAIAQVWDWSNWQTGKGIVSLRGAVLGDAVIKIVDDTARGKVYMEPVHPGALADVTLDKWGNVKSYIIEESRYDPRDGKEALYREVASRDGDNVVYQTYLNGALYPWDGETAEWTVPYGFIPMVVIQHKNVGLDWGWSELHAGMSNFREADDQASLLNDQVRKMVNSPWFYSGVSAPKTGNVVLGTSEQTADNPQAGREDVPAIYGPAGSTATPLVTPLDITAAAENINQIISKIERDYPELADNLENAGGDISGRALRINRQPVIDKVDERRPNYDAPLVRAQQMAVAIGGWRGYGEAFSGFDLNSYAAGKLAHTVNRRPVFAEDPLDNLDVEVAFWTAANQAKAAGMPLEIFLKRNGWSEEDITEYKNSAETMARQAALDASVQASRMMSNGAQATSTTTVTR